MPVDAVPPPPEPTLTRAERVRPLGRTWIGPASPRHRARPARMDKALVTLGEWLVDRIGGRDAPGGAPFNVACHVAGLGMKVCPIGRVGADGDAAQLLLQTLRRFGVSEAGVQRDARWPTGLAHVAGEPGHERYRIEAPAAWDALDTAAAERAMQRQPPHIVYFGTLSQRHPVARQTITRLLDATPAIRLLDLNLRPGQDNRELAWQSLHRAEWVKVNADELTQLLLWFVPRADPTAERRSPAYRKAVAALMRSFAISRLVVTYGAEGYDGYGRDGRLDLPGEPAPRIAVADAVGAGDAFCGAWIAVTLAGVPLCRALPLANRYAAAACAESGPVPQDDEFFASWRWIMGMPLPQVAA